MNIVRKIKEGFTLVEILIVVVIIGILASVAIPTYMNYVKRSYASDAQTQIRNIIANIELYAQENGTPPSDTQVLEDENYMTIKPATREKWSFEFDITEEDGLLSGTVTATSLAGMNGGEGEQVVYNYETGIFTGYGQKTEQ
jgi:prepilin-type N-terminal cleavage/methylation domain-containing protein